MYRKEGNGNKVSILLSRPFLGARMHNQHARNSALMQAVARRGEHAHHIFRTQTSATPEVPAKRISCQGAESDVEVRGYFQNSTFPARHRHCGHAQQFT